MDVFLTHQSFKSLRIIETKRLPPLLLISAEMELSPLPPLLDPFLSPLKTNCGIYFFSLITENLSASKKVIRLERENERKREREAKFLQSCWFIRIVCRVIFLCLFSFVGCMFFMSKMDIDLILLCMHFKWNIMMTLFKQYFGLIVWKKLSSLNMFHAYRSWIVEADAYILNGVYCASISKGICACELRG